MLIDHIVCRLTVLTIRVTRNLPQVGPIRALYEWAATTKTAEAAGMMDWAAYVRRNYQAFMRPPQFIPADSPTRMYRGRPGLRTDCMPNIVTAVHTMHNPHSEDAAYIAIGITRGTGGKTVVIGE